MKCHNVGEFYQHGQWFCKQCGSGNTEKSRRPLTDWEKVKLSFYRSEKKWIENIQDRKIVTDRSGNKIAVSQGRVLPMQPRALWPKLRRAHQ